MHNRSSVARQQHVLWYPPADAISRPPYAAALAHVPDAPDVHALGVRVLDAPGAPVHEHLALLPVRDPVLPVPAFPAAVAALWSRDMGRWQRSHLEDRQDDRGDQQQRAPLAGVAAVLRVPFPAPVKYCSMVSRPTACFSVEYKAPTSINTANHFRHLSLIISCSKK